LHPNERVSDRRHYARVRPHKSQSAPTLVVSAHLQAAVEAKLPLWSFFILSAFFFFCNFLAAQGTEYDTVINPLPCPDGFMSSILLPIDFSRPFATGGSQALDRMIQVAPAIRGPTPFPPYYLNIGTTYNLTQEINQPPSERVVTSCNTNGCAYETRDVDYPNGEHSIYVGVVLGPPRSINLPWLPPVLQNAIHNLPTLGIRTAVTKSFLLNTTSTGPWKTGLPSKHLQIDFTLNSTTAELLKNIQPLGIKLGFADVISFSNGKVVSCRWGEIELQWVRSTNLLTTLLVLFDTYNYQHLNENLMN